MLNTCYFCRILKKLEFSRQIFENSNIKFVKTRLVGAELFLAERRTD
jgi:hypothetical protein